MQYFFLGTLIINILGQLKYRQLRSNTKRPENTDFYRRYVSYSVQAIVEGTNWLRNSAIFFVRFLFSVRFACWP